MTTAGIDPNLAHNIQLLQKQSLQVEFHLDHTDYKKVENIGTGAYGVVCSAINRKTRQKVAIKKIPNIYTMDPRYAIRTYREIKILQHFKHGNVIAIREILQPTHKDITDIYVVMDLMESDLHRIIYSKQTLTDEHVMYFLYQILRGLKYIHSANVIHRDLKPSNLLVNADCELKIGDFGMARGIMFKAEKSNMHMTQYVATRWYRAPELIVAGRQGYGSAIDMWSVGCIFAEMLRRKHLFPGRDLVDQLGVIFGTLGIPSGDYLQKLNSDTVCGFIRKVTERVDFKPKSCAEICPKASSEAVDLLSKMLVIEPEKRIRVEEALKHPFMSKYHDISYEPNCSRKFDFAFEQELINLDTDDQKRVKIQDLLRREVLSYTKPKAVDFGALISSKSQESSQPKSNSHKEDNPYADLNAFLAQLASTGDEKVGEKKSPNSNPLLSVKTKAITNSLLDAQKGNSLLAGQGNSLLAAENTNSLLAGNKPINQLLGGQTVNPLLASTNNPLLAGASTNNPLLAGASTNNPLLAGAKGNPLLVKDGNNLPFQNIASNSNPLLFGARPAGGSKEKDFEPVTTTVTISTTSDSDLSNDTELFNSFLKSKGASDSQAGEDKPADLLSVNTLTKPAEDEIEMISAKLGQTDLRNDSELFHGFIKGVEKASKDSLSVNTLVKPAADDIEMISAKLEQTEISTEKSVKVDVEAESKPMDTKSLLRQRLMDKKNSNAGNMKGTNEKPGGKQTVTAFQRQKEREERRKAKQQKAKERKRKSKEAAERPVQLLTSEDQKMLDRWKAMAKPQHIQPKVTTQTNNVIVVYPAAAVSGTHTYITTTIPAAVTTGASVTSTMSQPAVSQTVIQTTNHSQSTQQISQTIISGHHQPSNSLIAHNNMQQPASKPATSINSVNCQPGIHSQHMSQASQHIHAHQYPSHRQHQVTTSHPAINHNNVHLVSTAHQISHPSLPTQQPISNQLHHAIPDINSFTQHRSDHHHQQRQSQQIRSFSDIAAMHGHGDQYYDVPILHGGGQETSLYDMGQGEPDIPSYSSTSTGYMGIQRPPQVHVEQSAENFSNWANNVSVHTSLDLNTIAAPKQYEGAPPMLVSTPKGTGAGYGVGYDMESMMAFNPDLQSVNMDSAPLSASLLADWMDVTSNMDPKALEDIQNELEMSSALHDFPFNY